MSFQSNDDGVKSRAAFSGDRSFSFVRSALTVEFDWNYCFTARGVRTCCVLAQAATDDDKDYHLYRNGHLCV